VTLSRRHLLTFAAGAAAGAAMPAAAVARSRVIGVEEWAALAPMDFSETTIPGFKRAMLDAMTGPRSVEYMTLPPAKFMELHHGHASIDEDPVRHPEGRDDPTEYA
jgi:hypothetical protein